MAVAAGETSTGATGVGATTGLTVSVAVLVTPLKTAEMVAVTEVVTVLVVTVKFALVLPAATVTLVGMVVATELSESDTTTPPTGAAALKVTVPIEELPPTTPLGLREIVDRLTAATSPKRNVNGVDHSLKLPARSAV